MEFWLRARKEEAVFCCAVWYLPLAPVMSVVGAIAEIMENLGCEEAAALYFSWLLLFIVSRSLRSREEAAVCCWSWICFWLIGLIWLRIMRYG